MQGNHYNNGFTVDFIDEGSESQTQWYNCTRPQVWFQSQSCLTLEYRPLSGSYTYSLLCLQGNCLTSPSVSRSVMSDSVTPMDCSPPHSSVHGIPQVTILKWVAISFSRGFSQPRDRTRVSRTADGFLTTWATKKPKSQSDNLGLKQANESAR